MNLMKTTTNEKLERAQLEAKGAYMRAKNRGAGEGEALWCASQAFETWMQD